MTVKDGLESEMKIIIPDLFDGRERRGAMAKPLLDKLGEGGGMEGGESTDTARNVLSRSQDLVQTLSQQMRQAGLQTPFSHSHPTWHLTSPPPKPSPRGEFLPSR